MRIGFSVSNIIMLLMFEAKKRLHKLNQDR